MPQIPARPPNQGRQYTADTQTLAPRHAQTRLRAFHVLVTCRQPPLSAGRAQMQPSAFFVAIGQCVEEATGAAVQSSDTGLSLQGMGHGVVQGPVRSGTWASSPAPRGKSTCC